MIIWIAASRHSPKPNKGHPLPSRSKPGRILAAAALACIECISLTCPGQNLAQNPAQNLAQNPGQDPGPLPRQDPAPTYPVQGVVLNSLTRQPIPRALVDAATDATLTDGEGRFELNLPAGIAQITTRRPGYASDARNATHAVRVDASTPSLSFSLTPFATITGRVILSTGEEASGIAVSAFRRSTFNGHDRWNRQNNAMTNSEGVFRIEDIEAPVAYVLCTEPSHDRANSIPGSARATFGYPSVCYPEAFSSSETISSANLLNLTPGQQAAINIALAREPFYRVSVAVLNHPATQGVYMEIHDSGGRHVDYWSRWNPQQGIVQVDLPNGQYYAEVRSNGPVSVYGRVDFKVANAPLSGLSVTLVPLHPLLVRVHRDFTATDPQTNGTAFVHGGLQGGAPERNAGLNLSLAGADSLAGEMGGGLQPAKGATDPNLFEIENISPGRYWIETFPFEGYIASITSGGVDLTRQPMVIGSGDTAAPIDVELRNDGGQIKGTINQPPAQSASAGELSTTYLYALPAFPTTSLPQRTESRNGLPFTFTNLAPGPYKIVATAQEIDPNDSAQLSPYAAKGQPVTIQPGGTENLQLDVIPSIAATSAGSEDQSQ
jgi:hypothetical protein